MTSNELCPNCKQHKMNFQSFHRVGEKNQLFLCFRMALLQPAGPRTDSQKRREIKEEKRLKLEEMMQKVSALRNSNGGILSVHMRGINVENRCMGLFNEYVDTSLNSLIDDGRSFDTQYFKNWYRDKDDDSGDHSNGDMEYLMLTVTGSNAVSTADFKTKVTLDDSIIRPTSQNMDRLFEMKREVSQQPKLLRLEPREECRNIQFKSMKPEILAESDLDGCVNHIWNKLRLPEYITTFSKLPTGGSYYVGVSEKDHAGQNGIRYVGVPLPRQEHESFRQIMLERIKRDIVSFSPTSNMKRTLDEGALIIEFHSVGGTNYVIEIAVAPVHGCVFYDPEGPETYIVGERMTMRRLEFDEWLKEFKNRTKKSV